MATGITVGWRVLHAAYKAKFTWAPFRDSHLLMPIEVRDLKAPDWPVAKCELNIPITADHVWNWQNYLAIDDKIAIVSDEGTAARRVIFCGYVVDGDAGFDRNEQFTVTCCGYAYRLARDREYLVYGRYMNSKGGDLTHYSALPCVFNAGGQPNRAVGGEDLRFTHDHDPFATWWRTLDAIEYLLARYNPEVDLPSPTFTADERAASPIVVVDVEGLHLWEALAKVADHGGYDVFADVSLAGGTTITHDLRVVKRGAGEKVILDHQAVGGDPIMDLDRTNLFAARIAETTASCVTAPVVFGGRDLYEITVELGRAWDPEKLTMPDGGSIVQPGAEKKAASNPWLKRYWTGGAEFGEYSEIARRWDANTDGDFSDEPWSLSVTDVAALAGQAAGTWPAMPYQAIRMLTEQAEVPLSAGRETLVEFTTNGGTNWYPLRGYKVLRDRLGIWITVPNLAAIYPDGGEWGTDNIWSKILAEAAVKVRLTCTVAAPDRNVGDPGRSKTAGTIFSTGAIFDKGRYGQSRKRATSSRFTGSGIPADEFTAGPVAGDIALEDLNAVAKQIRDINAGRFIEAGAFIEWVDPVNTPIGGVVQRIGGIGVAMRTNTGAARRYPRIIGRIFHLKSMQTEILLDTDRQAGVI